MAKYQSLICDDIERREQIVAHGLLNGIDYIEVVTAPPADNQRILQIFFIEKATPAGQANLSIMLDALDGAPQKFAISGGVRIQHITVESVTRVDDSLELRVSEPGDFFTYTLTIDYVWGPGDGSTPKLDPVYATCDFSFKAGCPSEFDCHPADLCPEETGAAPPIDYMAKDYASFRQALLDLIPTLAPEWQERNPADLGIALVELLAYAGDQLSYYQDAVANEAYLETARQRISVRRHARLIDYQMHDGASARAFVHVGVNSPGVIPAATPVLAHIDRPLGSQSPGQVIAASLQAQAQAAAGVVFETMTAVYVHQDLSDIPLYAWGNRQCCLPRRVTEIDLEGNLSPFLSAGHLLDAGILAAQLRDHTDPVSLAVYAYLTAVHPLLAAYNDGDPVSPALQEGLIAGLNDLLPDETFYSATRFQGVPLGDYVQNLIAQKPTGYGRMRLNRFLLEAAYPAALHSSAKLIPGDYLLFEEVTGPETGLSADADPTHRQAVRLTAVIPASDPLTGQELTSVRWDSADALAFPLCLSARASDGQYIPRVSVARGNLILADHGQTIAGEDHFLPETPPSERQRRAHRFLLQQGPLSFRVPRPADNGRLAPAVRLLETDPRLAQPQITRLMVPGTLTSWQPVLHLLDSDPFDPHIAVETDNDGRSLLRFGDDVNGMAPPDATSGKPPITVHYRVGVGRAGNVGADALVHLVRPDTAVEWPEVTRVRNPLAAWGGIDPEPMAEVKQLAPAAFQAVQKRAVTAQDYALAAELHPEVARAVADFRWTGSWHTVFLTIDPLGQIGLPEELRQRVKAWVTHYTQAGYDLKINPPIYVPLEIEVDVCVKRTHFRADVKQALLAALSSKPLPNGQRGFFHPDNFTFGQSLYLSQLYAAIEAVTGVDSAEVTLFKRFYHLPDGELAKGTIPLDRLEVLRLENDPSFPEYGVLRLHMLGGK